MARGQLGAEQGGVLVMTAVWLPVILVFASFVVDIGNFFEHQRHLQTQVDAGALAGGDVYQFPCDNNAITNAVRSYSGAQWNPQVANSQGSVTVLVNSTTYANQGGTDFSDGTPCSNGYVDVKATEHDVPLLQDPVPVRRADQRAGDQRARKGQHPPAADGSRGAPDRGPRPDTAERVGAVRERGHRGQHRRPRAAPAERHRRQRQPDLGGNQRSAGRGDDSRPAGRRHGQPDRRADDHLGERPTDLRRRPRRVRRPEQPERNPVRRGLVRADHHAGLRSPLGHGGAGRPRRPILGAERLDSYANAAFVNTTSTCNVKVRAKLDIGGLSASSLQVFAQGGNCPMNGNNHGCQMQLQTSGPVAGYLDHHGHRHLPRRRDGVGERAEPDQPLLAIPGERRHGRSLRGLQPSTRTRPLPRPDHEHPALVRGDASRFGVVQAASP